MPFGIQLEQTLLPISALRDYFIERTELIKLLPLEGVEYIFYNLCISTKLDPEDLLEYMEAFIPTLLLYAEEK
ncbi:unnamed protein product [Prunus armeniaca]|uniref:Uncharacterized protein n=1 Tax=Prunus armeniaca TaxID=36596 RepID=A0A6J5XJC5_PRUAR|nr:unnamed protein product [Prunus armeniaca]CAB4312075.1 unnamed protein product [Prunus armeniaca]